ncbi:hypothetical protein [Chondromyces crocatus]|uniref:Uncharacterized protein n=1 Tax=Chondromyces crocatus TaxID=52 RepID=A0A0K1EI18_CHOCO|nr:hypothetical protein [Chondromyces crocatus]AKT40505.1 uncharacterized protein CMC5_046600 [Chondromyces crocatus]
MSEHELSRHLASRVVDALRARARIAVVKGGATALLRELDAAMAGGLATLWPRIRGGSLAAVSEEVRDLGDHLSRALRDSEHVEDIFADETTLQNEAAEALQRALEEAARAEAAAQASAGGAERRSAPTSGNRPPPGTGLTPVQVRLDTLGYVAATVSKRAPEGALQEALSRAADAAGGMLTAFDKEARSAVFALGDADPDARLELEEAIADEFSALVESGHVALPSVIRRVELGRVVPLEERDALRRRLDAVAARTLLRSGCGATWELEDGRTLLVTLTPLSERDALQAEHHVSLFAREFAALHASAWSESSDVALEIAPPSDEKLGEGERSAEALEETVVTSGGELPGAPAVASAPGDVTASEPNVSVGGEERMSSAKGETKHAPKKPAAKPESRPARKRASRPR